MVISWKPFSSGKTGRLHTQLDKWPVTSRTTREARGVPSSRKDEAWLSCTNMQGPCDLSQKWRGTLRFLLQLEMSPSYIPPNAEESREAPPNCTVSLTSQRHSVFIFSVSNTSSFWETCVQLPQTWMKHKASFNLKLFFSFKNQLMPTNSFLLQWIHFSSEMLRNFYALLHDSLNLVSWDLRTKTLSYFPSKPSSTPTSLQI